MPDVLRSNILLVVLTMGELMRWWKFFGSDT
jgi:hypothetical protein